MADPSLFTEFRAPYPGHKVTSTLPRHQFDDPRASEASVQIKRNMLGDVWTYKKSSDRTRLVLPFKLTREKSLELENFLKAYHSAHIHVTLFDGSEWDAELIGQPVVRTAVDRRADSLGKEVVEVTLTLSAKRLV